uniref:N-acetylmuramoyl-L-alanine amidase n=1 Tax=uncultured bacterium contig00055 TaxID=1181539 RepID=A0A806K158_9BACT|nr:hypothetical protein [uncultured bacterium contig00055]
MKINQNFLSLGKKARGNNGKPVHFTKPVTMIIIHWIGPYPGQTVGVPWNWWENGPDKKGVQASAHFVVKGEEILQALPLDEVGWHSGDARNYSSVGIEIIPMNELGEFAPDTKKTLKELVAHIRTIYPQAKLGRHYDGTQRKDCPRWYTPAVEGGDEHWIALRNYLDGVGGYDE